MIGVGIDRGETFIGNVGIGVHIDYTLIGSPVNRASRLQDLSRERQVVCSERVMKTTSSPFAIRDRKEAKVKGIEELVSYIELDCPKKAA